MKKARTMVKEKKHWPAIIGRFTKADSVEFFVRKTLDTLEDPEEVLFVRMLAQKKIEELEREYNL
ncbi:hypothetical protein A3N54_17705 [Klebsiella aerogenes]|nr:hypothetical protein A3N54_17705 [Klebsiella aerogenes]RNT20873.1 hypothetical protein B9031_025260 [Klebsiella aerogenes]RSW41838.1 hypothetical protein EGH44_26595 [Klebsiella aerogenes]